MEPQFIRIRNRIINVAAIAYIRLYEDLDRVDVRLLGPPADVSLTISLEGEEAEPVREFFQNSQAFTDLRPADQRV